MILVERGTGDHIHPGLGERVGESIALRISPDTGCYEFADSDGTVFWTVVPVAPLTWNWISPFRSPLRPDTQNLYSPFRLAREWLLLRLCSCWLLLSCLCRR